MFDKQRRMASQPTPSIAPGIAGFTLFAAVLAVLAAACPQPASAQSIYTVTGVPIDESAANEVAAKKAGLVRGKSAAFDRLMARLTLSRDRARIPELDRAGIEAFITDFSLVGEKFGGGRYLAALTVRFQAAAIRRFLEGNGLAYSETQGERIILLPVLQAVETALLWDESNIWLSAWSSLEGLDNPPVPLIVPLGDFSDVSEISAGQAIRALPQGIAGISGRYRAAGAIVAIARQGVDATTGTFRVDIAMTSTAPGWPGVADILTIAGEPGETLENVFARAAQATVETIDDIWKGQNIIQPNQARRRLNAEVPLSGLSSWVAIQRRLAKISPIKAIDLTEITIDRAAIEIAFVGSVEQLQRSLRQNGLTLVSDVETGGLKLIASQP